MFGSGPPDGREMASQQVQILASELRRVQWALAVIAGLIGAIAVHLIFVQVFLPGFLPGNTVDGTPLKALTAISDLAGALLSMALAAPGLHIGGSQSGRRSGF